MAVQRLSNSGRSGFSYKSLIAGITPIPSVPTIGTATAVDFQSVNVAFTAPGAYAGSTYTATSSPGGLTGTSASSPILVEGLSELTEYTFTVKATNATGTSGSSAASSPVTTPAGDTGVMYPISTVTVGSAGTSTITFSSIPQTYTHLQLRWIGRNSSTNSTIVKIGFNSADTTYWHLLYGDGSSASATALSEANPRIGNIPLSNMTANSFGTGITDILDYTNTSKFKTLRSLAGYDNNGNGYALVYSGLWKSTSAITTITISPGADNFSQYSSFTLYGIKGA